MFSSRERIGKSEGPSELGPSSCEHQEEESWGELKGLSFVEMDVLCGGEGAGLAWSLGFPTRVFKALGYPWWLQVRSDTAAGGRPASGDPS